MLNHTDLAYLEEVEARYNESTPGQWTLPLYGYTIETAEKKLFFAFGMGEPAFADMRFVCAAHTDIPRLIAMVRAGEVRDESCDGCAHHDVSEYDEPCCWCSRIHSIDRYAPMDGQRAGDDHIGDANKMVGEGEHG